MTRTTDKLNQIRALAFEAGVAELGYRVNPHRTEDDVQKAAEQMAVYYLAVDRLKRIAASLEVNEEFLPKVVPNH